MIKCKGCGGQLEHVPIEPLRGTSEYFHAGPAYAHIPETPCEWFMNASVQEIGAYLNVAEYKARQTPPPGLATK